MVDQLVYFHDSSAVTGKGVYACTLASTMGPMLENLPYHSAISNGIIGREAFAAIPNILETFYKMVDESPLRDSQIAFSNMFMTHHVPVRSLHEMFAADVLVVVASAAWKTIRLQVLQRTGLYRYRCSCRVETRLRLLKTLGGRRLCNSFL